MNLDITFAIECDNGEGRVMEAFFFKNLDEVLDILLTGQIEIQGFVEKVSTHKVILAKACVLSTHKARVPLEGRSRISCHHHLDGSCPKSVAALRGSTDQSSHQPVSV